jgi:hypothetical protein
VTQLLKRWEESTFELLGQSIRLKVKAPLFDEAPEFLRKMIAFGRAGVKASTAEGVDAQASGADSMFASLDAKWVRSVFAGCIRPSEPILVEDEPDAKPIQTGAELYEIANAALVLQVLAKVQELVMLGAAEGKASSSPSTSAVGTGMMDAGGSPVTSTGPEDGTAP